MSFKHTKGGPELLRVYWGLVLARYQCYTLARLLVGSQNLGANPGEANNLWLDK